MTDFISRIFDKCEDDDRVIISTITDGVISNRSFRKCDQIKAQKFTEKSAPKTNTYFHTSTRKAGTTARGSEKDLNRVICVGTDFDILGPAHAEKDLPKDAETIHRIMSVCPIKPSITYDSGHGIDYLYFLDVPEKASNPDWEAHRRWLKGFGNYIMGLFAKEGYRIDDVYDLTRMLRWPGSLNIKKGCEPVTGHIITDTDQTCTIDDFQQFESYASDASCSKVSPVPMKAEDKIIDPLKVGSADRIFSGCQACRALMDNPSLQTEPLWHAMLTNIGLAVDGREKGHEFSSGYAGYSFDETDRKTDNAIKSNKPCTCEFIRGLGGSCPESGCGVKAPIVLANYTKTEQLERLLDSHKDTRITADEVFSEDTMRLCAHASDHLPALYSRFKTLLRMSDISLRDFEKAVRHIKSAMAGTTAGEDFGFQAGGAISFDGLDLNGAVEPPGYRVSMKDGVQSLSLQNGELEESIVCSRPVVITSIMENLDDGQECMELAFTRNSRIKTIIGSRSDILSRNSIVRFADSGLPVSTANNDELVEYLSQYEDTNEKRIPYRRSLDRFGWVPGRLEFFPMCCESGIVFQGDEKPVADAMVESGDYEIWKDTASRLRENPMARAVIAASAASPLIEILRLRNFILHVWCGSRSGKTATLKFALSMYGDPLQLLGTFNSTAVGLERRAGLMRNLPVGIDELQEKSKYMPVSTIIYQLANGRGKTRGAKAGGLQDTKTWRCAFLTTGEEPMSDESSMDGVTSRAVELYGVPIEDAEFGRQVHQISETSYGFAGKEYLMFLIREILSHKGMAEQDFSEMRAELKDTFEIQGSGDPGPHLDSVALVSLGDWYLSRSVFAEDMDEAWSHSRGLGISILMNIKKQERQDSIERAWSFVTGWISSNRQSFEDSSRPTFGKLESGRACIIASVLKKALDDEGFSYRKCVNGFMERGYIRTFTDKSGKSTYHTLKRVNGIPSHVIEANVDFSVKEEREAEDRVFLA